MRARDLNSSFSDPLAPFLPSPVLNQPMAAEGCGSDFGEGP